MDNKNLIMRLATAFVFTAFFLVLFYFGNQNWSKVVFLLIITGALPIGVREFALMGRRVGCVLPLHVGVVAGWAVMLHFVLKGFWPNDDLLPLWLALSIAAATIHFGSLLFEKDLSRALISQALSLMAALYLGLGLGFQVKLLMVRANILPIFGWQLIFALYLIVWLGDSTAYFLGNLFGQHKLAPAVSPKKTWEGAVGNLVGNIIAAFIIKFTVFNQHSHMRWSYMCTITIALLLGVVGQLGDLVESAWKRSTNVKDSDVGGGIAIPGHGGLLDRIDSLVFAAPVFYAYLYFLYGLR